MSDQTNGGSEGFRITLGVVYTQVEGVKGELVDVKTQLALLNQSMSALAAALTNETARVEKLEGRFNGMMVGIGAGVITALVAVFRGVMA